MSTSISKFIGQIHAGLNYVWDVNLLDWVAETQPTGGGGGGGTVTQGPAGSSPWLVAGTVNVGTLPAVTGAVTANAGSNLNTSALALESGGNLATLAGKDFATAAGQSMGNASLATVATNSGLAATAAKQDTGNTSLGTIATNSGLAATAAKQDTGNTSLATIATNTGLAATAAKQDTGNTSLATIATNATGPLALENGNLATIVTNTGNLATLVTQTAPLVTAQGANATSIIGPMVQAVVSDSPPTSYVDNMIEPLSLTSEGRLRVATYPAEVPEAAMFTGEPDFNQHESAFDFIEVGAYV